jgi:hypothetical protein
VKEHLAALVNAPLGEREESKIAEMDQIIAVIESEVCRRNTDWP